MARARKKLRKCSSEPDKKSAPDEEKTADKPSTDVTNVKSIPSDPTKVENLLLALRNQPLILQQNSDSGQQGLEESTTQSVLPDDKVDAVQDGPGVLEGLRPGVLEGLMQKTSIKELEIFMMSWLSRPENAGNLLPSLAQKESIVQETGIEKKRLEGW